MPAPPPTALTMMSIRPKRCDGLRDHPVAVRLVGRVGRDREPVGAGGLDPLDGGVAGLPGPAGDRDPCPGSGERLGERGPDAAAAARDEGDPPLEAEDVELAHRAPRECVVGSGASVERRPGRSARV